MTKTTKATKATKINTYPELPTWSARIRAMSSDGLKTAEIARALEKRYQHVRNVLITPLKKDMVKKD